MGHGGGDASLAWMPFLSGQGPWGELNGLKYLRTVAVSIGAATALIVLSLVCLRGLDRSMT